MEHIYGKLILQNPSGPEQEYELSKASVTIGRGAANDIILNDGRVSRSHARLECNPAGCMVIDLGSSNGTRLNGHRVERASLTPGDVLNLGGAQLRFEAQPLVEELGMTVIENEAALDLTLDREALPVAIHETDTPRLAIITSRRTWEISLDEQEVTSIGRADHNTVVLPQGKASRQHAEITRRGELFVLRDMGSTNGTWLGDERVDEIVLQDGDVLRIGEAQLVFKGGSRREALTIADEVLAAAAARRPVVFIPGTMGSELWLGNERVWPNVKYLFKQPELFRYPSEAPLEARAIVDEVVIVPNLLKVDQYNRLGDYLVEDLGYTRGVDFFEFPYDWRQDVRRSARQLGEFIAGLGLKSRLTLIGHSLGTMVGRYYIEHCGGREVVERAVLMGGPHQGAVKIMASLLIAPEILPFGLMGERFRRIIATFPSCYQIIPTYPCATDQNGQKINFLEDESWVAPEYLSLLRQGREFRQELGKHCSVPAISIFGYGLKTHVSINLKRNADGRPLEASYATAAAGDGTLLERSTILDGTELHPVQQYHGSLFVDNDVKMRLKLELARQLPVQ